MQPTALNPPQNLANSLHYRNKKILPKNSFLPVPTQDMWPNHPKHFF